MTRCSKFSTLFRARDKLYFPIYVSNLIKEKQINHCCCAASRFEIYLTSSEIELYQQTDRWTEPLRTSHVKLLFAPITVEISSDARSNFIYAGTCSRSRHNSWPAVDQSWPFIRKLFTVNYRGQNRAVQLPRWGGATYTSCRAWNQTAVRENFPITAPVLYYYDPEWNHTTPADV